MNIKKILCATIATSLLLGTMAAKSTVFAKNKTDNLDVNRVLLISIDGFHASDLTNFVKAHPNSTLALLKNHGINYPNASSSKPSDSFPGMLALATGGTPNSTGVFYDDSYDRSLLAPGAKKGSPLGTEVLYDESVDIDSNRYDAGGGLNPNNFPIDPKTMLPVFPHSFNRANTIFEVIKAAGYRTAWSDKHPSYEILNGPSGKGVDDLFTPEINNTETNPTGSVQACENYDDTKVQAILNEIDGYDSTRQFKEAVPTLFGMNFQAVSVGQKLPNNGYVDANGTPSAGLENALEHTDASLGKIVSELKKNNLFNKTEIIITAKHGQSPMDPKKLDIIDKSNLIADVKDQIAQITTDDIGLIWLKDQSKTAYVADKLRANAANAGIKEVLTYGSKGWLFNNPATDSRVPDIVVVPNEGVIYSKPTKIAEHGGFSKDDTNVALLISSPTIRGALQDNSPVETRQVAPTILKSLDLNPNSLMAVKKEHTKVLPGLN